MCSLVQLYSGNLTNRHGKFVQHCAQRTKPMFYTNFQRTDISEMLMVFDEKTDCKCIFCVRDMQSLKELDNLATPFDMNDINSLYYLIVA